MIGHTSGYTMKQTLPTIGITVYLGMIEYEVDINRTENFNRGIIPDYQIKLDDLDVIAGKDRYLDFALKLAKEY